MKKIIDQAEFNKYFAKIHDKSLNCELTDAEFDELKWNIECLMNSLDSLQKIHNHETGKDFVRPIRLSAFK